MRPARWITLLWPGLTQLWFSGAAWGLAIACGFAWLVNLAVVSSFVWTELIGSWSRAGVWLLLIVAWGASVTLSFRQLRETESESNGTNAEDLFLRARREYLSGNWICAEQSLTELVRTNGRDVDAQLMLVSLLRRTGQLTEASDRLRRLEATDGAEKWNTEITRERQLLDQLYQSHEKSRTESEPITQTPANQAA